MPETEIPDELKELEKRFVGRKVLLCGDHPHADRVGIVDRLEFVSVLRKWGFIVRFEDGNLLGDECFVFEGKDWRVLDEKPKRRIELSAEDRAAGWTGLREG